MTIVAGIEWIQSTLRTLPGLRAPVLPPGSFVEHPTAIVYEGPGDWHTEAKDQYRYLGTIYIDLPVPGSDVEQGIRQLRAYLEILPKALLADTTLGGGISTFGPLSFSGLINLLPESEGQEALLGYRWILQNAKLRSP